MDFSPFFPVFFNEYEFLPEKPSLAGLSTAAAYLDLASAADRGFTAAARSVREALPAVLVSLRVPVKAISVRYSSPLRQ